MMFDFRCKHANTLSDLYLQIRSRGHTFKVLLRRKNVVLVLSRFRFYVWQKFTMPIIAAQIQKQV